MRVYFFKKSYIVCICFSIATNLYLRKILYLNSSLNDYKIYKVTENKLKFKKMHFIGHEQFISTTNFNKNFKIKLTFFIKEYQMSQKKSLFKH